MARPDSPPDAAGDPYAVLGVSPGVEPAELRRAYHEQVLRYHPDRHQGNPLEDLAKQRLATINWAYALLSDPRQRAAYDAQVGVPPSGAARDGRPPANRTASGRPAGVVGARRVKWVVLLLALPLAVRFIGVLARGVVALGRALFEATAALRGTPVAAAVVLLLLALGVFALIRRRRGR